MKDDQDININAALDVIQKFFNSEVFMLLLFNMGQHCCYCTVCDLRMTSSATLSDTILLGGPEPYHVR